MLVCGLNTGEFGFRIMSVVMLCVVLTEAGADAVVLVWEGEGVGSMQDGTGSHHGLLCVSDVV